MNKLSIFTLKALRKLFTKVSRGDALQKPACDQNPDSVSQIIYDTLMKDEPCMIARFGAFELTTLVNYVGVKNQKSNYIEYIKGNIPQWWWNEKTINYMHTNAGFFPPTEDKIEQFCELMFKDMKEVDILGSWLDKERVVDDYRATFSKNVHLRLLEPFWSNIPWTKGLEGKKVLVIHPFTEIIISQYGKRSMLFKNEILPEFELITLKAVQSLGGVSDRFSSWFEALDYMKLQMDSIEYDVCLIGAGAYGFPLAAYAKRQGKKSVHLGGALQLLFGIRGKRWENPDYGVEAWGVPKSSYSNLMNDYWVRPGDELKPKNANQVEGACYW